MTPQIFNYELKKIRTITREGEPWFIAKDVAEVLGYSDTKYAIRTHCKYAELLKGEESSLLGAKSPFGIYIIPERDLYRLIMRSKLPTAERFEEWVVGEVLPQIRKTGGYSIPAAPTEVSAAPTEIPTAPTEIPQKLQVDNSQLILAVQAMQQKRRTQRTYW